MVPDRGARDASSRLRAQRSVRREWLETPRVGNRAK